MVKLSKLIKGQSLVEIIIAIGLAAILLPALVTGLIAARSGKPQQLQRTYAIGLTQETIEAARVVRQAGWPTFAVNGTYHPVRSGSTWALVSGGETINDYTRTLTISDAYRDGSGKLVETSGTMDPSVKKLQIDISWANPAPTTMSTTVYFTRYLDNLTYIQTTEADFLAGTKTGVTVTNTGGGEVTLGAGGFAEWCEPDLTITALDLPKNGVANALTAIEGKAFAGTGENASGVSYASVDIANTHPPQAAVVNTFNGFKTNDIFGDAQYAYLATDTNTKEIEIISLNSPVVESGYFDSSGPTDANAIFVSGAVGYMTAGNTLYTFDLSSKSGSRAQLGSIQLAGTGTEIEVNGGYAFVSINGSPELQIVNVANPASLSVIGQADLPGAGGSDVYINSTATRAYVVTSTSASQKELFIIDVSTKTGNRPVVGSYESNGTSAKGVTVVSGNKAILVGSGGEEYQVIDITNESNPSHCGGLNIDTGVNGVASVIEADGDAYSYIITGDASAEFKIIEGGPGGQYATSGIFESSTFDAGTSTNFNRFDATSTLPNQTAASYQFAVADAVNGNCTGVTFTFVDANSDGSLLLSDDGVGYENPGRCLRYRVNLSTTEPLSSPVFADITINYSP